jgi:xanthine/CO dehydrogenase XdhC/CoxF family maturation factor
VSFEKSNGTSRHFVMTESHDAINVFFDKWRRPITLSVIGCGPDSLVFTEFARPLGWTAMFYDYRQAYAAAVPQAQCLPTKDIARAVKDGDECAVVLMTHNYQADMEILAGLVKRTFAYVGCLGPRERYERLKQDLKMHYRLTLTPEFEKKLYAPAGLLAKGRSPEDIALTIIAQIQMVMSDEGNDDR